MSAIKFPSELAARTKIAADARASQVRSDLSAKPVMQIGHNYDKIIAIGASTGGTKTIFEGIKICRPIFQGSDL